MIFLPYVPTSGLEPCIAILIKSYSTFYKLLSSSPSPQILKGAAIIEGRPGESLPDLDFEALKSSLEEKYGAQMSDESVMSAALYPKVFDDFMTFSQSYGPVEKLDTRLFFVGPNVAEETEVGSTVIDLL